MNNFAQDNLQQGQAYLAQNAKNEDVCVLASGLQYRVITSGEGKAPTLSDRVRVHYRGKLLDGTEFDSSYSRNQPLTFPVSGVIAGWVEALQLMHEGDTWELTIPSDLAYGLQGAGGDIGPNATLIFEVELLAVE